MPPKHAMPSSSATLLAQSSLDEWRRQGHTHLVMIRAWHLMERQLQETMGPPSITTRKRKIEVHPAPAAALEEAVEIVDSSQGDDIDNDKSNDKSVVAAQDDDMSLHDSISSASLLSLMTIKPTITTTCTKNPRRSATAPTFATTRPVSAKKTIVKFTVRAGEQALGLMEGLVPENKLYTVKDYKRHVLWEGHYEDETPVVGRFAENIASVESLASGDWVAHWLDMPSHMNDDWRERRFLLRHTTQGITLPPSLPSSLSHHSTNGVRIKILHPCQTRKYDMHRQQRLSKNKPFFVGSLSLFGFEGFDSHHEMMRDIPDLEKQALFVPKQAKPKASTTNQGPPFWSIESMDGKMGVTLLCALAPHEQQTSYQIRLAVDDNNQEVVGLDVIFTGDKTILSPAASSPSAKSATSIVSDRDQEMDEVSNGPYMDDDDDDDINNEDTCSRMSSSDSSGEDTVGSLAKALKEHLDKEHFPLALTKAMRNAKRSSPSVASRAPSEAVSRAPTEAVSRAATEKITNHRRISLDTEETNVPKTVHLVKPLASILKNPAPSDPTTTEFHTVQKPTVLAQNGDNVSVASRAFPLVTPHDHQGPDHYDDNDWSIGMPRDLGDQFETLSVQCLNAVPFKVHPEGQDQVDEDLSQDSGLFENAKEHQERVSLDWLQQLDSIPRNLEREKEVDVFDAGSDASIHQRTMDSVDGDALATTRAVDSAQGLLVGDDIEADEETKSFRLVLEILVHDVFFGGHDEVATSTYHDSEVVVGAIASEAHEYETFCGYVWGQWVLPVSTMLAMTLPVAHYLYEHCHELELVQEPEIMTWTGWFYSKF